MTRNPVALASLFVLLVSSAVATAEPRRNLAQARGPQVEARKCMAVSPCANCVARTPILHSGRPPLPGEGGSGVQTCTLINDGAAWDAYCADNVVPECPLLNDAFFVEHTVVALAVDTATPRGCEGTADPTWKLDCVTPSADVRLTLERPGGWCRCSAMPQQLQRLFLVSAVPKTSEPTCRACVESRTINCPR
jgi:hypothetical protein